MAFSPHGQRLASSSDDRTVKVWDIDSGPETFTLKGHTGSVIGVSFIPDGRRIASASQDATIKVWDVGSGQDTNVSSSIPRRFRSLIIASTG